MQIRELVQLGKFLSQTLSESNLPNLYQQLVNAINKAAQNQKPTQVQTLLEKIRTVHEDAAEKITSPAQSKLLKDYGADRLIGSAAVKRIDEILLSNQAHPQGLASAFGELLNETNELNQRATQLIEVVQPLFPIVEEVDSELAADEGRLWLYFSENVAVESINDLESAAETWKQILHGFSRLPNAAADGGRIIQIQKRSPLELELAAGIALLTPLAFGVNWVLGRIEHVIKILQEAEKLKQLKVKTEIVQDLKKEAEEEKKKIAEQAADAVREKFNCGNEERNAVQQALSKVIRFIEGGGQLDIDIGDDDSGEGEEDGESSEERKDMLSLIKSIRQEIKQLPAPPPEEENHDSDEEDNG